MSTLNQIAATLGFPVVVLPETAAGSTEPAIRFLADRLVEGGLIQATFIDHVMSNLLRREMLGSTALGEGVALPHSMIIPTSGELDRVIGILAHCSSPVPWETPDGQESRNICLILAPHDRPGEYMRVLEQVARAMREKRK